MKVYIDQHGRFGDILYTLPIVQRLKERGYEVLFYIHKNFSGLMKHFPDINFIEYDKPTSPIPEEPCILLPLWHAKRWKRANGKYTTDELLTSKYEMYNFAMDDNLNPLTYWRNLKFERFPDKEKELVKILGIKKDEKYILINENYHYDLKKEINIKTDIKKIQMNKVGGFSLLDWCSVIENAEEIHTVHTSIVLIIDLLKTTKKLYIYDRKIENVKILHLLNKEWIYHV